MSRDLKWGVGGGLLIIFLGQLAGRLGLLGHMQMAPLVAAGADLILLTFVTLALQFDFAERPSRTSVSRGAEHDSSQQLRRTTLILEGRRMLQRWAESDQRLSFAQFLDRRGFFLELRPNLSVGFQERFAQALAQAPLVAKQDLPPAPWPRNSMGWSSDGGCGLRWRRFGGLQTS